MKRQELIWRKVDSENFGEKEKAFYADVAFDFEVNTTIGWLELVACNYRSDYDLSSHAKKSKEKFEVMDNDEKFYHMYLKFQWALTEVFTQF